MTPSLGKLRPFDIEIIRLLSELVSTTVILRAGFDTMRHHEGDVEAKLGTIAKLLKEHEETFFTRLNSLTERMLSEAENG